MRTQLRNMAQLVIQHSSRFGWITITAGMLALVLGVAACSDDDVPTAEKDALLKTWSLGASGSIEKYGSDVTGDYVGLEINFNEGGTYTAQNAGHFFQASGTWVRKNTNELTLDGDLLVKIVSLTATDLNLQLTLAEGDVEGGRTTSLIGEYDIHLKAQ